MRQGCGIGRALLVVLLVAGALTASPLGTGPVGASSLGPTAAPGLAVPDEPPVIQVAAGTDHSCALLATGEVKCWGANDFGQLGQGDTVARGDQPDELGDALPPIDLGTGRTATAIVAAGNHTCALLDDGRVKCWGKNDVGQLGLGDTFPRGYNTGQMGDALAPVDLGEGRTAVAITAGAQGWYQPNIGYTCALLDDGSVKCWGGSAYGQLGQGVQTPIGDGPGEMAALAPIDLGPGRTALAIDAGASFACALRDTHDVVCWGEMDGVHTIGQHIVGDSIGDDPGEMGSALVPVNLGPGHAATDLSVSSTHACAIREDQSLVCWGENNDAQLGSETSVPAGLSAPLPDDHPAVNLGTGRTARALATGGYHHTCALLDDDTVKCWGDNQRGTLGTGDVLRRGDEPGEMGDGLLPVDLGPGRTVRDIALGDFHACAVLDDATVKCWGENQRGQLGIGDTFDRGDEPDELGDQLPVVDLGTPPDAPSLRVELTANRATVRVGRAVRYDVTVTNTGNVDLTGVRVDDPDVPACAEDLGVLAQGDSVVTGCWYFSTADDLGTFTNQAVVTSDQTGAVTSNRVDVTVLPVLEPDLALKLAGHAFIGVGVPGPGPVGQTIPITRSRGSATTFFVRLENAGQAADRFDLVRVDASPGVGARYFRGRTATELTDVIRRGSYLTRLLEPGETVLVRVEVTVGRRVPHGAQRTITLRSHPGTDPVYAADTVRIALRIR